jgi:hypothetical protein
MDFDSKIKIDDNRKVDILLKLMESFRSQIMAWHDRAYFAAVASFGLLLGVTKLWINTKDKKWPYLICFICSIIIFEVLTQFYLRSTRQNYQGNEDGKLKCEYALRLKDEDAFFNNDRFFWKEIPAKELGRPPRDINLLINAHIVVSIFLSAVCVVVAYFKF